MKSVLTESIAYDPNYCGDDIDSDEDYEDEDDDEGDWTDDEDMSWKVRRASAKCFDAFVYKGFTIFFISSSLHFRL